MSEAGLMPVTGGALAWLSDGSGEAIVLVHAGIADARMWEPLVPLLDPACRVIRYDMRGFGRSRSEAGSFAPARDLLELLDGLGVDRAMVVGASFGGLVALEFTALAPQRVSTLVLLAPLLPGAEPSEELRASWEAEETALDEGRLDDAVELNLRTWVDRSSNDPEVRALVGDMQANAFRLQLETEIEFEELEPPVGERLGGVGVPVIVAVGERDLFDFQHMAARLAGALPNATLRRMPNAGHLLALERPREIAELVLAALR